MSNDAYRRGLELLEKLHGGQAGAAMVEELKDICPDFATMTIEWAIGGIMGRPGLDLLTRELVRNALILIPDVYGPAKSG